MKRLLIATLALAVAWSVYWFIGAQMAERGMTAWFDARRAEGWQADAGQIRTRGFPNRFDTTLTDVALADPDTGLAWDAPFFQIFALSYRPNHLILAFPNQQDLAWPTGRATLESDQMQASLVVGGTPAMPLERATLVADVLNIRSPGAGSTALARLQMSVRRIPPQNARYQISVTADGLAPSPDWGLRLDGDLPRVLDTVQLDAQVHFDQPWGISALETQRPQPRSIDIRLAEARWGQLELKLAGAITVDEAGLASGDLTLKAQNWREILQIVRATGQWPDSLISSVEQALTMIGRATGNTRNLDMPLRIERGTLFAGPLPVGRLPAFRLR